MKKNFSKKISQSQASSPNGLDSFKRSFQKKYSHIRQESPPKTFIASKAVLKQLSPEEQLVVNNKKVKAKIETILDSTVNVKNKETRALLNETMRMEQLDGLPETLPEENQKKKRKRRRARVNGAPPKFYEKLEARRNNINQKLLRILERVELDRPIVLREKFKVLWNMDSNHASNSKIMKMEIGKLKTARNQINAHMADTYLKILNFIEQRYHSTLTFK